MAVVQEMPLKCELVYAIFGGQFAGKRAKPILIPTTAICEKDGTTFIKLTTKPRFMQKLFTGVAKGKSLLAKTDVFEKLKEARYQWFFQNRLAPHERDENKRRRVRLQVKLETPNIALVDVPSIADAPAKQIMMVVSRSYSKKAPLFVEFTMENIAYLQAMCSIQVRDGTIRRERATRKNTPDEINDSDDPDKVNDGEDNAGVVSDGIDNDDEANIDEASDHDIDGDSDASNDGEDRMETEVDIDGDDHIVVETPSKPCQTVKGIEKVSKATLHGYFATTKWSLTMRDLYARRGDRACGRKQVRSIMFLLSTIIDCTIINVMVIMGRHQ